MKVPLNNRHRQKPPLTPALSPPCGERGEAHHHMQFPLPACGERGKHTTTAIPSPRPYGERVRVRGGCGIRTVDVGCARALFDPMESDRRSSFLFGRIFFDEPVSTSSENALAHTFLHRFARHLVGSARLVPQPIHFLKIAEGGCLAHFRQTLLDMQEATGELLVRTA